MIKQCGKDTLKKNKQKLSGRNTCASTNKEHLASEKRLNEKKKKIQVEIDGKFQTIWDRLEKDIQRKVRKEG